MPFATWLSLGAGLGAAYVVAVRESTSARSLSSAAMVGRLRARGALTVSDFDLHLGPELRVLAPPTSIRIDGREVVRVPAASFGAALDVGARLLVRSQLVVGATYVEIIDARPEAPEGRRQEMTPCRSAPEASSCVTSAARP